MSSRLGLCRRMSSCLGLCRRMSSRLGLVRLPPPRKLSHRCLLGRLLRLREAPRQLKLLILLVHLNAQVHHLLLERRVLGPDVIALVSHQAVVANVRRRRRSIPLRLRRLCLRLRFAGQCRCLGVQESSRVVDASDQVGVRRGEGDGSTVAGRRRERVGYHLPIVGYQPRLIVGELGLTRRHRSGIGVDNDDSRTQEATNANLVHIGGARFDPA